MSTLKCSDDFTNLIRSKFTAGDNINIDNGEISSTDTTYENATTDTNGLMSSEDKTKLDSLNKPVILFNGDSNGSFTLNDDCSNYDVIEFYFIDDVGQWSSQKVYSPNNKTVTLSMAVYNPNNKRTYVQTATKEIKGTSVTHKGASEVRIDSISANTGNYIWVRQVIGYKI